MMSALFSTLFLHDMGYLHSMNNSDDQFEFTTKISSHRLCSSRQEAAKKYVTSTQIIVVD